MKQMSKADRVALWNRRVEAGIVAKRPELAGKVDWNTITYLGFLTVEEAVNRYCDKPPVKLDWQGNPV